MKILTQCEFVGDDCDRANKIARHLGYMQTAYISSSDLIGLYCLPDRPSQHRGCVIKTVEFGFLFVQDAEDIGMEVITMDAYVYRAAMLCADCAQKQIIRIENTRPLPEGYPSESDAYPQGPYPQGGGEADCPQHCDHCGLFLENPLTGDGYAYVAEQLDSHRRLSTVMHEWTEFYERGESEILDRAYEKWRKRWTLLDKFIHRPAPVPPGFYMAIRREYPGERGDRIIGFMQNGMYLRSAIKATERGNS